MKKSNSVPKYPTVAAYKPGPAILKERPDLCRSWLIPTCAFCGELHVHGAGEGRREEHCPRGPDWYVAEFERPYGYTLKLAGECNDPSIFDKAAARKQAKLKAYYDDLEERALLRRKGIVAPTTTRPLQSASH
ncbi:hypothetical protein DLM45_06495 [Hyphomicrobium methylovorum]|nr:hypothetical protein [Hyphomicrobium methylovorum]